MACEWVAGGHVTRGFPVWSKYNEDCPSETFGERGGNCAGRSHPQSGGEVEADSKLDMWQRELRTFSMNRIIKRYVSNLMMSYCL